MKRLLAVLLGVLALASSAASHSRATLDYKIESFRCSESLLGGLDSCSGDISISIDGASNEAVSADVTCEVRVNYDADDIIWSNTATARPQETVFLTAGFGTARLRYRADVSSIGKTIRAKIASVRCRGQVLD